MVWKQDLAKLKQQLKAEPDPGPPAKPPKAAPPKEARPIQDEDALFLSAMGVKSPRPKPGPAAVPAAPAPPPEPPAEEGFSSAMAGLKGLKPMTKGLKAEPPAPPLQVAAPSVPLPVAPVSEALPEPPMAPSESPRPTVGVPMGPRLIHLAAGMAVEVDGALDLRGHSEADARDRLKERMHDAQAMGWRTMLVTLGEDARLREALLEVLRTSPQAASLRYAQAPIPMGGGNAWILYFG